MRAALIAVGMWWNANTVSHLFIHRPFFRTRAGNAWCAAVLTALLGFPQSLWRDRHLAHHRHARFRFQLTREIAWQIAIVAAMWLGMMWWAPHFFAFVYLPGYAGGLLLCAVHGHYEHAGGTTSHYGWTYNALCFNDGYHVEHHRHPAAPWWTLPRYREAGSRASAWPAPLRWLPAVADLRPRPHLRPRRGDGGRRWDGGSLLAALERVVLRSPWLQRWVVRSHARAFERLLDREPSPRTVAIVGGGLFPRTALVLKALAPDARLTIVDSRESHLERARAFLRDERIEFVHQHFTPQSALCNPHYDLLVLPLSFEGDKTLLCNHPPSNAVLVHDWIWRRRGRSCIVSALLLKRLNLVRGCLP
jgi:hypothetical protein